MARQDRFYIGMLDDGASLQADLKPFAIPDNAFSELNNAYVWRGRVRKRFGARLMEGSDNAIVGFEQIQSRLKINIGTTDGAGSFTGFVPRTATVPVTTPAIGQAFSVEDTFFTVNVLGTPATLLSTDLATATYDTTPTAGATSGQVVITGADPLKVVYFYPATPVMGLITYEQPAVNDEQVVGFDTRFAYQFTSNGWTRLGTGVWSGTDSQPFWGYNYVGALPNQTYLYVTNYNASDVIKYFDGSDWVNFSPIKTATNRILTAKIIIPFKGRLLFLNTVERLEGVQFSSPNVTNPTTGNFNQTVAGTYALGQQFLVGNTVFTIASVAAGLQNMTVSSPVISNGPTAQFNAATGNLVITGNNNNINLPVYFFDGVSGSTVSYVNRLHYSRIGSPVDANSWVFSPGLGSFIDAPTKEAIVTAQFLKDRLIVYFESSTWEVVFTNNQSLPYLWQKINTELGAESTFSQVPFDKVVLGVGNVGIQACNGSNVERIDEKIPDSVFEIHNDDSGIARVAGIRDYFAEMVYWTFPDSMQSSVYPFNNKVLVYNYRNGAWAFNDDSITSFGYFQELISGGQTWEDASRSWQVSDFAWASGNLQSKFRDVIAGNQEGYTFVIDINESSNSQSLQITDFTYTNPIRATLVVINHNLRSGQYVKIQNCIGITGLNDIIVYVVSITDPNTIIVANATTLTGTYKGGGTLTRVTPIDFKTKQYNFYASSDRNAYVSKVDCLVSNTRSGQCSIDFLVSSSNTGIVAQLATPTTLPGSSILETSPYDLVPYEQQQDRLWHPVYLWADGQYVQLRFYLNRDQSTTVSIAEAPFELHAMNIYATPTSSRLQ